MYIIFLKECTSPDIVDNSTHTSDTIKQTDTIIKTVTIKEKEYVPEISYRDTGSTKYITLDTAEALFHYNTKIAYIDTLINSKRAFIIIIDTLQRNQIISRSKDVNFYDMVIKETNTVNLLQKKRNRVFIGAGVGGNMNMFSAKLSAGLLTKKRNLYTLDYDPFNKIVSVSVYWEVRFRR